MIYDFTRQIGWVVVFLLILLSISFLLVKSFRNRRSDDRSYKYIPAIAAFIATANLVPIYKLSDTASSNLILLILFIFLIEISVTILCFTLLIALFYELRSYIIKRKKETQHEE